MNDTIQVGKFVRMLKDIQRVGMVVEVRRDQQLNELLARVRFGDGTKTVALDEVEIFDPDRADIWSDVASLKLSRSGKFRTLLTYERLRCPPSPITSAFGTARARFFPFQFKALLKFLESPRQRVLIADDVGLGKTIEAGYILREWKARHPVSNVLIVVPARLRTKWKDELGMKFGETFDIVKASDLRAALRTAEKKDFPEFQWIIAYESIRDRELVDQISSLRPGIDLLIMDEAHRVRNRNTDQYRAARILTELSDAVILLSATPVQTGLENLHTLVDLLEPDRYGDFEMFQQMIEANQPVIRALNAISSRRPKEAQKQLSAFGQDTSSREISQSAHFQEVVAELATVAPDNRSDLVRLQREIADFSLLGHLLSRTRKLEVMERWPKRVPQSPRIILSEAERAIYSAVRDITRLLDPWNSGWGADMSALMAFRYTASCIPAAVEYLRSRLAEGGLLLSSKDLNKEVDAETIEEELGGDWESSHHANEGIARRIQEILDRCPAPGEDSKFVTFKKALEEIWADDRRRRKKPRKVVVFSFFKRTLAYLDREIQKAGIQTRLIHGDIPIDEREDRISDFLNTEDINVLLSSEVGGEGIDLQRASVVVNYDLPWNPMVVEQRIGRIDRIGQEASRLIIINLYAEETIEEKILFRLYERIGVFRESIGELDEILGPTDVKTLMLDALRANLTPEQKLEQLEHTAEAAERKRQEARALVENVDGLLAADQSFIDEINRLIQTRRLPEPDELRELLLHVLETRFSGNALEQPKGKRPGILRLSASTAQQLQDWAGRNYGDAHRVAAHAQQGSMPVTFDAGVAMQFPSSEFIQARHPLMQFAINRIANGEEGRSTAFGVRVASAAIPAGLWVLAVFAIDIKGARAETRLEPVAQRVGSTQILFGDEADSLLLACLGESEDLDPLPNADASDIESCTSRMREAFNARFAEILTATRKNEERRFDRRRATWEQTLKAKRDSRRQQLDHLQASGGKPFAIRMAERRLSNAERDLKTKLDEFKSVPRPTAEQREIAVALVEVCHSRS